MKNHTFLSPNDEEDEDKYIYIVDKYKYIFVLYII